MKITFTSQPIDKIQTEVIVLMYYENDIPFKGLLGMFDWRVNGRFSEIIKKNQFSGRARELILIPSENRMKASEIIVVGLGSREVFKKDHISQVLDYFLTALQKKRMQQVCFSLNQLFQSQFDWRNAVRLLLSKLFDYQSIQEVILCEPADLIKEAKRRQLQFGPNIEVCYQ